MRQAFRLYDFDHQNQTPESLDGFRYLSFHRVARGVTQSYDDCDLWPALYAVIAVRNLAWGFFHIGQCLVFCYSTAYDSGMLVAVWARMAWNRNKPRWYIEESA